jgi:Ca2+-binding RTX toxin-like protein
MYSFEGNGDASGGGETPVSSGAPSSLTDVSLDVRFGLGEQSNPDPVIEWSNGTTERPDMVIEWSNGTTERPDMIIEWSNGNNDVLNILPGFHSYATAAPAFDADVVFLRPENADEINVVSYLFEQSSWSNGEVGGSYIIDFLPSNTQGLVNGADAVRATEVFSTPSFNPIRGDGQTIVVIDTRFDSDHALLGPDTNGDGRSDRVLLTWDFADGDANVNNTVGVTSHGTFVASVAAGAMQGATLASSFYGIAPSANLILLKVASDGSGTATTASIQNALSWAANPQNIAAYGISVVNMSMNARWNGALSGPAGGWNVTTEGPTAFSSQFQSLVNQGIPVVVSAGNYARESDAILYPGSPLPTNPGVAQPASDPNAWSVGATYAGSYGTLVLNFTGDSSSTVDQIAAFSQRHPSLVDIFAPGAVIEAAGNNNTLLSDWGTSFAAPFVTGTVALMQDLSVTMSGVKMAPSTMLAYMKAMAKDIFDSETSTGGIVGDPLERDGAVQNTNTAYDRLDVIGALNGVILFHGRPTTSGDDRRAGWDANDTFLGQAGNDILLGNGGIDALLGQDGNDFAYGGLGVDFVYGGAGNDTLYGGTTGADTAAPNDWDTVYGGDGVDLLYTGGDSRGYLLGEAGADTLTGGIDVDWFEGGAGSDTIFMGQLGADLVITRTNDILAGNTDAIYGFTAGDLFGLPSWAQGAFWVSAFNTGSLGALNVSGGTYYVYFEGLTPAQVTAATGYWA